MGLVVPGGEARPGPGPVTVARAGRGFEFEAPPGWLEPFNGRDSEAKPGEGWSLRGGAELFLPSGSFGPVGGSLGSAAPSPQLPTPIPDCSCILRTRVESFGAEKNSEDSSSQDSTDESAVFWSHSPRRGDEQISWSSDVSHYDLQVEIGKGCNDLTSVYLARHIPTGRPVAVRITDLERCSEERLKALQNEVTLCHAFRHPNIMTLWAVFTTGSWLWVISPFMAYSSASHLLRTYFPDGMSEALIGNILFGAISGLSYMHHHGYIHRSIKASHILISGDGLVYLSGLNHLYSLVNNGQRLKAVYDFPQFSTSVLPWLSPELLRQDIYGYNVKSDIYSVGITACELANGRVPFQDMPRTQMLLQKLKGPPYCPWSSNTFPCSESRIKNSRSGIDSGIGESMTRTMTSERLQTPPKTFSPAFHNLIELCLQQDPEKRPSARGLLSHTFFKQVSLLQFLLNVLTAAKDNHTDYDLENQIGLHIGNLALRSMKDSEPWVPAAHIDGGRNLVYAYKGHG